MDTELAKTFLEVMQHGTFAKAAEQLHVTQTTVTTRVQTLESVLGAQLFVRNRKGAKLTPAGERFVVPAKQVVATWEQAKKLCASPDRAAKPVLSIGSEGSLWNPILADVMIDLVAQEHYQVHSQVSSNDAVYQALRSRQLDAILVHSARYYPDVLVEQVAEEKLVHVRSTTQAQPDLYVDWGEAFERQFESCLPFDKHNAMYCSLGPLALRVMLQHGGNGHFRTRVVAPHLASGALERVEDSPEFSYPIYLVSQQSNDLGRVQVLRDTVKRVLEQSPAWNIA